MKKHIYLITLILIIIWLITTSATLQVITINKYIPDIIKLVLGVIQILFIAGITWCVNTISKLKNFMITQVELNKENDESRKHTQELSKLVFELKGIISNLKK